MKDLNKMLEKWLLALQSYGRHFLTLAIAQFVYLINDNQVPSFDNLIWPALIATIGPALKAVNPNETSFGFVKKS